MILVSAILPTKGRQAFAARALECFLAQTYPNRQLVILDDETDPSFGVIDRLNQFGEFVLYALHADRLTIPQKRNECCAMASGQIIAHWDSDDWSAPTRLADQVARLTSSGKSVTAYHSMLFYHEEQAKAFLYRAHEYDAIGTSLAFTKEWWAAHPFKAHRMHPNVGEDSLFSKEAREANELTTVEAGSLMVARIHAGNTSPKNIRPTSCSYKPVDLSAIPAEFFG